MKPTSEALLRTLQRVPGEWVPNYLLAQVGGMRFGGRIHELRQAGYLIECRGTGPSAQYRLVASPAPTYAPRFCVCGWSGSEVQTIHTHRGDECPRCGKTTSATRAVEQLELVV